MTKSGKIRILAMFAVAALLLGGAAYAAEEFPPSPLSVKGYIFNEDGSPAARGISVTVFNEANGQIEQTQTGTGYPPLRQYDNAYTASLAYNPLARQAIKVIARSGDHYSEASFVAAGSHESINLTLRLAPEQTESEAKIINIIGGAKKPPEQNQTPSTGAANQTTGNVSPAPQKDVMMEIITYSAIGAAAILLAVIFMIMRKKKNKTAKHAARKAALAVLAIAALALALPAQTWIAAPASIFGSIGMLSDMIRPTALMSGGEAVIFAPPQPISVSGYVFHSNGTFVENCTSVNVTIRAPNGTITNIEQTCTGKGFPPAPQFYPRYTSSVTGTLNSDTTNVTAWNATHQGRNSSLLTSDTIYLNITINEWLPESVPPQFSNNQSQVVSGYSPYAYSNFSISWEDNTDMAFAYMEANFTGPLSNITMANTSSIEPITYTYNTTPLAAGTYQYRLVGVDMFNNSNATDVFYFTILQADNPVHLYLNGTLDSNRTITYPAVSNATGTATAGAPLLWRGEAAASNPEIAQLAAGTYAYKVNTSSNQNYSANNTGVTYYLKIDKAASSVSVGFAPSNSETYGTQTNATCSIISGDPSATLALQRNGSGVANPDSAVLGAGAYNYTCTYAESENYTASASLSNYLSIARADPSTYLKLELQGAENDASVNYPAASNATGYATLADNQDLVFNLYRNGTQVASGDPASEVQTLGAGAYSYVYNTSGGANYTAGTSAARYLTVNQTALALSFLFNGTEGDLAVNYNTTINMTVASTPSGKAVQIRTNYSSGGDNLWHSGTTPTEKISNYTVNGTWNFTAVFPGDQNYTAASKTHYLTVYPTDLEPPQWFNQSQGSSSPTAGGSNTLSAYWTDNVQLGHYWVSTNESGNWTNRSAAAFSGTGNWSNYSWSNSSVGAGTLVLWKIYANDTYGNENVTDAMNFTVAAAPPAQPPGAGEAPPSVPSAGAGPSATFDVKMSKSEYSRDENAELVFSATNPGSSFDMYADITITKSGESYKSLKTTKTVPNGSLEWTEAIDAIECSTPYGQYDVSVKLYYTANDKFIKEVSLSYSVSTCTDAHITKLVTVKSTHEPNSTMSLLTAVKNIGNRDISEAVLELFICNKDGDCGSNKLTKIKEFTFELPVGESVENGYNHSLAGLKEGHYELRATLSEGANLLDSKKIDFSISLPAAPMVDVGTVGIAAGGLLAAAAVTYLRRKALLVAPKVIVIVRNTTHVTMTVKNRTKNKFRNVVLEDTIPGKPAVSDISPKPFKVVRSNIYTKIIWKLNVHPKGKLKLRYKIGAKFKKLPKAKIRSYEKVGEKKRAVPKKHIAPKKPAAPKKPKAKKPAQKRAGRKKQ